MNFSTYNRIEPVVYKQPILTNVLTGGQTVARQLKAAVMMARIPCMMAKAASNESVTVGPFAYWRNSYTKWNSSVKTKEINCPAMTNLRIIRYDAIVLDYVRVTALERWAGFSAWLHINRWKTLKVDSVAVGFRVQGVRFQRAFIASPMADRKMFRFNTR